MEKIYHSAIDVSTIAKNGSEIYGAVAKCNIWTDTSRIKTEVSQHGTTKLDAKQKLLNFISRNGQQDISCVDGWTIGQQIKGLTIKQPFCGLVVHHQKLETRTWNTRYRGWVLLHSSRSQFRTADPVSTLGQWKTIESIRSKQPEQFSPVGYAVAVAKLVECRPMELQDEQNAFVLFKTDYSIHVFEHVMPIEPFPMKGGLFYFDLTENQIAQIKTK